MMDTRDDAPVQPQRGTSVRQAMWSWAVAIVLVVGLGLMFYGINARQSVQTAAKHPAIMAAPAPAAGVPPPSPETTTGQRLPAPERTGRTQ